MPVLEDISFWILSQITSAFIASFYPSNLNTNLSLMEGFAFL